MTRREDPEVTIWLAKAAEDEEAVDAVTSAAPHLENIIGFHCQQALEKRLKALLVAKGQEPPHIHDLDVLLDRLVVLAPGAEGAREACTYLKNFAVSARYPA